MTYSAKPEGSKKWQQIVINWAAGQTTSSPVWLGGGSFGTVIVPSSLNTATLQVVTELDDNAFGVNLSTGITTKANFDGINLLSAAKTLTTGANAFSSTELNQIGAAGPVRFVLGAAPGAATQAVLWWKD